MHSMMLLIGYKRMIWVYDRYCNVSCTCVYGGRVLCYKVQILSLNIITTVYLRCTYIIHNIGFNTLWRG